MNVEVTARDLHAADETPQEQLRWNGLLISLE